MHLNVPDAVSREHRDNVPIRPIGPSDEYRGQRKSDNHCERSKDCTPLLAKDVTECNFEYHDEELCVRKAVARD